MAPAVGRGLPHFTPCQALLIALGCGLLIGAERARRNAIRASWSAANLRTFAIAELGDGISMIAGGQHFCIVDSFLNPTGSRNLEYDEAVQPKPTVHE